MHTKTESISLQMFKLIKCVTVEYAFEALTVSRADENIVRNFKRKILKRIVGIIYK